MHYVFVPILFIFIYDFFAAAAATTIKKNEPQTHINQFEKVIFTCTEFD